MEVSWAGVTLTEVAAPTDTRWIAPTDTRWVAKKCLVCGRGAVFSSFFLCSPFFLLVFHHTDTHM
jgi:hypothetical protein